MGSNSFVHISENKQKLMDLFKIMPITFILPHEYTAFVKTFMDIEQSKRNLPNANQNNYWILKPVGLSRGRGISVIKDLNFSYDRNCVIQQYKIHYY